MKAKQLRDGTLVTFEKRSGMSGYFSGKERGLLTDYLNSGKRSLFIDRLYDLRILVHGHERETYLLGKMREEDLALKSLHIEITSQCPLACPECYKGGPGAGVMTLERFKALIQEADRLSLFQIALGGGEPLSHPELLQMVEIVAQTEMAVSLTTSGYGLTEKYLEQLLAAGVNHIQISLNSLDKHINRITRDGYGHTIRAIELLSRAPVSKGLNVVLHAENIATLQATAAFAREMGMNNINLLRFKPSSRRTYQRHALSREQFAEALEKIRQINVIRVKVDSANSYLLKALWGDAAERPFCGCGALTDFVAVTPEGAFKPCSHLRAKRYADSLQTYLGMVGNDVQTPPLCRECRHLTGCGGCAAIYEKCGEDACPVFARETDDVSVS